MVPLEAVGAAAASAGRSGAQTTLSSSLTLPAATQRPKARALAESGSRAAAKQTCSGDRPWGCAGAPACCTRAGSGRAVPGLAARIACCGIAITGVTAACARGWSRARVVRRAHSRAPPPATHTLATARSATAAAMLRAAARSRARVPAWRAQPRTQPSAWRSRTARGPPSASSS